MSFTAKIEEKINELIGVTPCKDTDSNFYYQICFYSCFRYLFWVYFYSLRYLGGSNGCHIKHHTYNIYFF